MNHKEPDSEPATDGRSKTNKKLLPSQAATDGLSKKQKTTPGHEQKTYFEMYGRGNRPATDGRSKTKKTSGTRNGHEQTTFFEMHGKVKEFTPKKSPGTRNGHEQKYISRCTAKEIGRPLTDTAKNKKTSSKERKIGTSFVIIDTSEKSRNYMNKT
jgi:hypothetical protein